MLKDYCFSLEKTYRHFDNKVMLSLFAFVLEFRIGFDRLSNGDVEIGFKVVRNKDNKILYEKTSNVILNCDEQKIYHTNSHADPMDVVDGVALLHSQMMQEQGDIVAFVDVLKNLTQNNIPFTFTIYCADEDGTLYEKEIANTVQDLLICFEKIGVNQEWYLKPAIEVNITADGFKLPFDCEVSHISARTNVYNERVVKQKMGDRICLADELKTVSVNPYKAIQFTTSVISNGVNIDLEEKHILSGQNGIADIKSYTFKDKTYYPIFPVNKALARHVTIDKNIIDFFEMVDKKPVVHVNKTQMVITISSLNRLLQLYKDSDIKPYAFEMQDNMLSKQYQELPNYVVAVYRNKGVNFWQSVVILPYKDSAFKIVSPQLSLGICASCSRRAKCMQVIPNTFGAELLKKIATTKHYKQCEIYTMLKANGL